MRPALLPAPQQEAQDAVGDEGAREPHAIAARGVLHEQQEKQGDTRDERGDGEDLAGDAHGEAT